MDSLLYTMNLTDLLELNKTFSKSCNDLIYINVIGIYLTSSFKINKAFLKIVLQS